ncbi:MAG: hypothetical protein M1829_000798 [Trizodia sp. TS-e1964]|nr:MAG: hypothetical protein M1829_000798 [Trizodia sp. TS-e1964]
MYGGPQGQQGQQQPGYPPPGQQYPSSHQANATAQGYGPGYGAQPQGTGAPGDPNGPGAGDRGLGSTLLGGGAGGFIGKKLGLGATGGAVLGAIGANLLGKKDKKHNQNTGYGGAPAHGAPSYGAPQQYGAPQYGGAPAHGAPVAGAAAGGGLGGLLGLAKKARKSKKRSGGGHSSGRRHGEREEHEEESSSSSSSDDDEQDYGSD